jgi:hypothetical protein
VESPTTEYKHVEEVRPRIEYTRRLQARRDEEARHTRLYKRITKACRVLFGLLLLLAWLGEKEQALTKVWLLGVPLLGYAYLESRRKRTGRAWRRANHAAEFYEKRLAWLDGQWAGHGNPGTRFLDENHPYALDLDIFGTGCLFELLCTVWTRTGENTLASWLRAPATLEEIYARQEAVDELRPQLDLREDLTILREEVPADIDLAGLAEWGKATTALASAPLRGAARLLMVLTVAALFGWLFLGTGPAPLQGMLLLTGLFALGLHRRIRQVLAVVERRIRDLTFLAGLLERFERAGFVCPRLGRIHALFNAGGRPASQTIAQLGRLIDRLQYAPVGAVFLWSTQIALALESWRKTFGPGLARWVNAVGEFEALCALAAYAYDNPEDPFPEVTRLVPCFEATALGHPLLPRERCVRNNVHFDGDLRLFVVSGSNMSGKSTLLRSVGVNAVLALAGAPVRAKRLWISPLVVGATLRIQDSLQAGRSRFYVEITRLRRLIDIAKGPLPLLFLLDEILHGTNSHDRRIGAEAVVRSLLNHGAIGLITTHDLTLTGIADLLAPRAMNVHFEDHFENGTMYFDYLMRPGVVQSSNALALMRSVGIEV